jgi:hypothetical protein
MRIQMNTEKLLQHIRDLEEEHLILDSQIKEGYSLFVNDADLSKLKYHKLNLKREIETLKQQFNQTRIKY